MGEERHYAGVSDSMSRELGKILQLLLHFLGGRCLSGLLTRVSTDTGFLSVFGALSYKKIKHALYQVGSQVSTRKPYDFSSVGKESACSAGDLGSIPGLGTSAGEGNGNPLQYPRLENLMDTGASWAAVHGVARSQAQLSN